MSFGALQPLGSFFQHGYVTNDFDRALAYFEGYGVKRFLELRSVVAPMTETETATLSVALGWYGNLQIEIIQPEGGFCDIYRQSLTSDDYMLRLHHHAFMLSGAGEYEAMRDAYVARGNVVTVDGRNPRSGNRYFYADTRAELGHYMEYIYATEAGKKDYALIPQNAPDG
jgi:hypothetical protein